MGLFKWKKNKYSVIDAITNPESDFRKEMREIWIEYIKERESTNESTASIED